MNLVVFFLLNNASHLFASLSLIQIFFFWILHCLRHHKPALSHSLKYFFALFKDSVLSFYRKFTLMPIAAATLDWTSFSKWSPLLMDSSLVFASSSGQMVYIPLHNKKKKTKINKKEVMTATIDAVYLEYRRPKF